MKRSNPKFRDSRSLVVASAFALTWLALPVSTVLAQSFPSYPLQTGAGNVEPNIMFILDDSGSMADEEMDNPDIDDIDACLDQGSRRCNTSLNITGRTYIGNTLYYNPAITYQPWIKADGTRTTGGTTLAAVFASRNFAGSGFGAESDTINLISSTSCDSYNNNGGRRDWDDDNENGLHDELEVCGGMQTFYVPKNTANRTESYLENALNYYRYQIRAMNGVTRLVRSELVAGGNYGDFGPIISYEPVTGGRIAEWDDEDFGRNDSRYFPFTTAFAATNMRATLRGNDPNAQLFLERKGNGNTWGEVCRGVNSTASGNRTSNEECTFATAAAGEYRVRVTTPNGQDDAANDVDIDVYADYQREVSTPQVSGCAPTSDDYGWGGCTYALPSGSRNSESLEFTNYATWFSYHRTRMKMAKAGAAEAFHQLGDNVRVGFRSLHQNNTNANYAIPVGDGNNGVFESTARTTWYSKLFNALGISGTPLRTSLQATGEYFKDSAASGPWGPGTAANQLSCRQSFAILTTDGYWNSDYGDITVGNVDETAGAAILDPSDGTNTVRYTPANPFQDGANESYSNTLADVAMKYWKEDLRSDLDNIVPTSANNPAFWQHMVTFGISIGLKGTVDQASVADILTAGQPRIDGTADDWPDPQVTLDNNTVLARIDDLLHAAVNGRGEFVAATNAQDFSTALNGVLGQIQSRLASGSNVATNSTSYQSNSRIYQATYRSVQWTGELVSRPISSSGISATPEWSVIEEIDDTYADNQTGNDYHNRTVLTWTGTAGAAFPTTAQSLALVRDTGASTVTGADNASYIKGNPALERSSGGTLRNRVTPFGDIINSSPFYVPDTDSIFVGANDGMLHGINALNGQVLFSYVPAGLNFTRLRDLSDPAYGHAYFVDGQTTVSSSAVTPNESLLVGALGRGGKGVFGLDVSDPDSMVNADVLWDKTAATDADMGYVVGAPVIVKTNDGSRVVLVPNGIESTNGDSVLYVLNLRTGAQIAKISTGNTTGNGLSTPRTADLDRDGDVDYVYAGDLLGNMWKFDLSNSDPAQWGVALGGLPLFVARSGTNAVQPITGAPALARETAEDRIWVTFGTGRFIYESDVSDTSTQTWYGVIDDGEAVVRADLTARDIAAVGQDAQNRPIRAFSANAELPAGSMGWFVDLDEPLDGERVIGAARVNGRAAIVSSMAPTVSSGCENEGAGFLNTIDLFTGTSPNNGTPGSPASFLDLDGDGTGTSTGDMLTDANGNQIGAGSVNTGVGAHYDSRDMSGDYVICGSNGQCTVVAGGDPPPGGAERKRLSWREIYGED